MEGNLFPPSPPDSLLAGGIPAPTSGAEILIRKLQEDLAAAARTVYEQYSDFDIQVETTPTPARAIIDSLLHFPLPPRDGLEQAFRRIVDAGVNDAHHAYAFSRDGTAHKVAKKRMGLRYLIQEGTDSIADVLPVEGQAHVMIVPFNSDASLHGTLSREQAAQAFANMLEMKKQPRLVIVADFSQNIIDEQIRDTTHQSEQEWTSEQIENFPPKVHLLRTVLKKVMGTSAERPLIAAVIKSLTQLMEKVNDYQVEVATTKTQNAPQQPVREALQQAVTQLKNLLGKIEISDAVHQTLRSGLQVIQQITAAEVVAEKQLIHVVSLRGREHLEVAKTPVVENVSQNTIDKNLSPEEARVQRLIRAALAKQDQGQKEQQSQRIIERIADVFTAQLPITAEERIAEVILLPFEINQTAAKAPAQGATVQQPVSAQIIPFRSDKIAQITQRTLPSLPASPAAETQKTTLSAPVRSATTPVTVSRKADILTTAADTKQVRHQPQQPTNKVGVTPTLLPAEQKQAKMVVTPGTQISTKATTNEVTGKTPVAVARDNTSSKIVRAANFKSMGAAIFNRQIDRKVSSKASPVAREVEFRKGIKIGNPASLKSSFGQAKRPLTRRSSARVQVAKAPGPRPS